jgi:hypothetical protein
MRQRGSVLARPESLNKLDEGEDGFYQIEGIGYVLSVSPNYNHQLNSQLRLHPRRAISRAWFDQRLGQSQRLTMF